MFLASRLKARRTRTKIASITHPHTGANRLHPQAIVDAFVDYYSSLYNLKSDDATPQPSDLDIQNVLRNLKLPHLTPTASSLLNSPISPQELITTIKTLPLNKFPRP